MSDRKPLKVVLRRGGEVLLMSTSRDTRYMVIGTWGGWTNNLHAHIWCLGPKIKAKDVAGLRYAIADRVPAIAEFISQRCEK